MGQVWRYCEWVGPYWPAPLTIRPDFWLWGVILAELRRLKPTTIPLLQNTVQSYCEDDVRRATAHCRLRAQVCAENGGSHFESTSSKTDEIIPWKSSNSVCAWYVVIKYQKLMLKIMKYYGFRSCWLKKSLLNDPVYKESPRESTSRVSTCHFFVSPELISCATGLRF